jgi:hypothetical protein
MIYWILAGASFAAGDFLVVFAFMEGAACPGSSCRDDPLLWRYTTLPAVSGIALLLVSGWLVHHAKARSRNWTLRKRIVELCWMLAGTLCCAAGSMWVLLIIIARWSR